MPVTLLKAIDESLKKHAREIKVEGIKRKEDMKNNLHKLMFDIAPNLLFVLDAKGCFRMVNNVFCKVTGYTKPVLIRPGTPRFFIVDDTATLAAVVNNNTVITSASIHYTKLYASHLRWCFHSWSAWRYN